MAIRLDCPHCGTQLSAPEKLAGKPVKCTRCKAVLVVPAGAPAPLRPPEAAPDATTGWSGRTWALCAVGLVLVAGLGLLLGLGGYRLRNRPPRPAAAAGGGVTGGTVASRPAQPDGATTAAVAAAATAAPQGLQTLMPAAQAEFVAKLRTALDAIDQARQAHNAVVVEKRRGELDHLLRGQTDFSAWAGQVEKVERAAALQDQTQLLLDLGSASTNRTTPMFYYCDVRLDTTLALRAYLYDSTGQFNAVFEKLRPGDIVRFSGQLPGREFAARYALPVRLDAVGPKEPTIDQLQGGIDELLKAVGEHAARVREGSDAMPEAIVVPLELTKLDH